MYFNTKNKLHYPYVTCLCACRESLETHLRLRNIYRPKTSFAHKLRETKLY